MFSFPRSFLSLEVGGSDVESAGFSILGWCSLSLGGLWRERDPKSGL